MAIFHGNAIPSGSEPQVIAPSSNDWDYSWDGGGEWPAAGNALGNHEEGGYVDNTGGDSALSSLITFDGDFDIEFTVTGIANSSFGIHEIAEDSKRATDQRPMYQSSTESWHYHEGSTGVDTESHWYGNTDADDHTYATGSVVKIERRSGVITFYDDGVTAHQYSQTSTNPVRFIMSAGGDLTHDYDNILFTDYEKVQRDGFYNNTTNSGDYFGDGHSNARNFGQAITMTRTGEVTSVKFLVQTATTTFNCHCEVWGDDGTNPTSQVGTDSGTISLNSTGVKTLTFGTPVSVNKGTTYWFVLVDSSGGSGSSIIHQITATGTTRSGGHDTITSISNDQTRDLKFEVVVETTEEPTPDHDTLLLIHSDTTDGSTTFTDSSQFGRTISVTADTQHDTAQYKFGTSSILFDGTGDSLTVPDSIDWALDNFTIEMWVKTTTINKDLIEQATSSGASTTSFSMWISSSHLYATFSNGSAFTSLTCSSSLTDDAWHHVAVVRSNTKIVAYVDGTSEATGTMGDTLTNVGGVIVIGRCYNTGVAGWYPGHMDEIRISRVARWDANFSVPTSPYPTD